MALESQRAALALERSEQICPRSIISRYYYAAFQSISAVLLYSGLTPPEDEEAWSHAVTPSMIVEHLGTYISSKNERQVLRTRLSELRTLRIIADYRAGFQLASRVKDVRKLSNHLVKVALRILPRG